MTQILLSSVIALASGQPAQLAVGPCTVRFTVPAGYQVVNDRGAGHLFRVTLVPAGKTVATTNSALGFHFIPVPNATARQLELGTQKMVRPGKAWSKLASFNPHVKYLGRAATNPPVVAGAYADGRVFLVFFSEGRTERDLRRTLQPMRTFVRSINIELKKEAQPAQIRESASPGIPEP